MIVMALALSLQDAAPDKGPCVLPEATQQGTPEASACDAAIAAGDRTTKAQLLYYRGYARNEAHDSIAALVDLDNAVALDSDNVDARQERAYTNNELGNYAAALADLDACTALGVATKRLFQERALSRMKLGDIAGALADRDRVLTLEPEDGVALNARADDLLFAGPLDERPDRVRPLLIGGALTSAALSLAGAAFVAWWRTRPATPMARAVRAVGRGRLA